MLHRNIWSAGKIGLLYGMDFVLWFVQRSSHRQQFSSRKSEVAVSESICKSDAAKLLASIPVTDDNFDIAMNNLINRYENKRIIIRTHLHSIVSYRSLTTDNAMPETKEFEFKQLTNIDLPCRIWENQSTVQTSFLFTWSVRSCLQRQDNNGSCLQKARKHKSMQSSDFSQRNADKHSRQQRQMD